jgi:uncharacterized membrane protein
MSTSDEGDERIEPAPPARRRREPDSDADSGRVLALSDGVFAIASTLLVLDLKLPDDQPDSSLAHELALLVPEFRSYALSYLLIGLFWLGHHRQFKAMSRIRSSVMKLNLYLLGVITLVPFSTAMLSEYGENPLAVALYMANIAAIFLLEMAIGHHVVRNHDEGEAAGPNPRLTLVIRPGLAAAAFLLTIPYAYLIQGHEGSLIWPFIVLTWLIRGAVGRYLGRRAPATPT